MSILNKIKKWFDGNQTPPYVPKPRYTVFYEDCDCGSCKYDSYIELTHPLGMYGVYKFMKDWYTTSKIYYIDVEIR